MASVTEKFRGTMEGLKGLLAVVGISLGIRELSRWIGEAIHGTAETKNLADRLGMTTEQMQKLGYAAKASGIDQESLSTHLGKLSENLAEVAITRAGPAADALRRLGLRAKELTLLSPADAFTKVVAALDQIPNAMERVKIAKDIFGKGGEGMISLALQGTAGLKAMGLEATATGVALSAIDNAKLDEADAAFTKIGQAIGGVANQIAVVLAPYITAASDQFIAFATSGVNMGSRITQAVDWITKAVGALGDAWQEMQLKFMESQIKVSSGVTWMIKNLPGFGHGVGVLLGSGEAKSENSKFVETWLRDLEVMKTAQEKAFGKEGSKPVFSETLRKFKDDLDKAAGERATFNAKKQGLGGQAGQSIKPALVKTGFAGAQQAGSSAAYSSILQARARITDSRQDIIAKSSTKTAENTGKMAAHLAILAGARTQGVDGAQFREQVSGR